MGIQNGGCDNGEPEYDEVISDDNIDMFLLSEYY